MIVSYIEHRIGKESAQNYDLDNLSPKVVQEVIVAHYKTEMNHGQHKGAHTTNKISTIKCKHSNPDFNKQENQQQHQPFSSSSSKQSGNQQQWKQCGSRGSGKNKEKGKQAAHSHAATAATLPSPSSHTIVHIGSSSMTHCVVSELTPPTRTSGPYSLLNKALTLAECLKVKLTIQTVKTLEQHFGKLDGTIRTCSNYNLDEEYDSEVNINMSQSVPSCDQLQTETYIDNLSSSDLFELCSTLDSLKTESVDSNKENWAPTSEWINLDSIVDVQEEDPEKQEIMDMWDRFTSGCKIMHCTSNEIINDAYRSHQEYLTQLMSPVHTTTSHVPTLNPSGTSHHKEVLNWGSDEEKYFFSLSPCTPYY